LRKPGSDCLRRCDLSAQQRAQRQILRVYLVPVGGVLSVQPAALHADITGPNGHRLSDLPFDRQVPLLRVWPNSTPRPERHRSILPVLDGGRDNRRFGKVLWKAAVPVERRCDSRIRRRKRCGNVEPVGGYPNASAVLTPEKDSISTPDHKILRYAVGK